MTVKRLIFISIIAGFFSVVQLTSGDKESKISIQSARLPKISENKHYPSEESSLDEQDVSKDLSDRELLVTMYTLLQKQSKNITRIKEQLEDMSTNKKKPKIVIQKWTSSGSSIENFRKENKKKQNKLKSKSKSGSESKED